MALPVSWARSLRLAGVLTAASLACNGAGAQGQLPAPPGVPNFARVNEALWRGAQPVETGIESLKKLGVATIVNLRGADDVAPYEAAAARRLGLLYLNVPLPGLRAPSDASVARLLSLLATLPGPVFVHCKYGADRTGTIIACYRIRHDGWTAARALAEARHYGMSPWEFGMRHYVLSLAGDQFRAPGNP